jgi:5-methylcytosine-specific restriction protein A
LQYGSLRSASLIWSTAQPVASNPRVATLQPRIAVADLRTARAPDKKADPHYLTSEHRAWRAMVIRRAGGRCQHIDALGQRCTASEASGQRMFADHIVELQDGGSPLDPANGMALCGHHHTLKTNAERARRHRC